MRVSSVGAFFGGGILCLGLASCGNDPTQPATAEQLPNPVQVAVASNTWVTRRDMPLDMVSQASAVVPNAEGQSILYTIAGRKAGGLPPKPMGEVRAYNVATNTWKYSLRDMPAALFSTNGAGVIDGKIYVSGGRTSNRSSPPSAALFVYDPAANAWTRKRDMPEGGAEGVTGVIQGKLYVVTFSPGLPAGVANFFRYDPTTDAWNRLPSPTNYFSLGGGGAVLYGKLYLIAHGMLVYDPGTNRWTTKGPLPGDLTGAPVALGARLYLFGADTRPFTGHPGIFIYHPTTDTWTELPLLTTLRFSDATDIVASRVFLNGQPRVEVVGGSRPGNNLQYIP